MKYFLSGLFAVLLSCMAMAQDAVQVTVPKADAAPAVPTVQEEKKFEINLTSEVSLYDFSDGSITGLDTELTFDVSDRIKLGFALPIYNSSNDYFDPQNLAWLLNKGLYGKNGTGLSDLDIFTTVSLIDGKCEYLKTDKAWLDFTGGIKVPLDGTYSSDDYVPHLGLDVGAKWGTVSLSYGFAYQIVNDYTFSPVLGGFVDGDIFESNAILAYDFTDDISVYFKGTQYNWDGESMFLLGPGFDYKFSNNVSFSGEIAIPTTNDNSNGELDIVLSTGIGFEF